MRVALKSVPTAFDLGFDGSPNVVFGFEIGRGEEYLIGDEDFVDWAEGFGVESFGVRVGVDSSDAEFFLFAAAVYFFEEGGLEIFGRVQ